MKHFANFAPSYNNIGLGVGAAVGIARGSGLIGESQEERESTTGLGRLGKLAGYTGGGAALGVGTGMAVKYVRGDKGTVVETPTPQNESRRKAAEVQTKIDNLKQEGQEAINAVNSRANPKPASTPLSSLDGYPNYEIKYRPKGFLGMSKQERETKILDRTSDWLNEVQRPINGKFYNTAKENSQNFFPTLPRKERLEASRKLQNIALNQLKNDIKRGEYSQPLTKLRNL
jgi:hypothetical protein